MTASEALRDIRGYAQVNRLRYSIHAITRMDERNATRGDVKNALITATSCTSQGGTKWKVTGGVDLEGDPLGIAVVLDGDVLIVTVLG